MPISFPPPADRPLAGRTTLVAGGTGNVGRHIVRALLRDGAGVVVPSRSADKLQALRDELGSAAAALVTVVGDVADERDAPRVRDEASRLAPSPLDGVVASLGRWAPAPSLLSATRAELLRALEDYVVAHFMVARTFVPLLVERGGSYTLVNGPSAFGAWPGSALVSVATAAQSMLARALAAEQGVGERVRLAELVIHPSSWIGPGTTSDGPIDGDAVGRYVAAIVAGRVTTEPTMHLDSAEQVAGLP
jgi:NAD(P)-dependent dehydrogenase (short-subunit alcohol dehydrogenase family)